MSELDKLINELERGSAKQRSGRAPSLYREEVDAILADERGDTEAAKSFGVSVDTIKRVRQKGRFRAVPYIPRDEMDRTKADNLPMSAYPVTKGGNKGRPFSSGRAALTSDEKLAIAVDHRPVRQVAEEYDVSMGYISKIRHELGTNMLRTGKVGLMALKEIAADSRDVETIAEHWSLPVKVIEAIRHARGQ